MARNRSILTAAALAVAGAGLGINTQAHAATFTYSGVGGETWSEAFPGWVNDGTSTAVFDFGSSSTTTRTVTVDQATILAEGLVWQNGRYVLGASGSNTVVLGADGISVLTGNVTSGTSSIDSNLTIAVSQTWLANTGTGNTFNVGGLTHFTDGTTLNLTAAGSGGPRFLFSNTGNTGSGTIVVNAGTTLHMNHSGTAGTPLGTGLLSLNGGRLNSTSGTGRTISNPISLDASSTLAGGATFGGLTFNGTFAVTGNYSLQVDGHATTAATHDFNGVTTLGGNFSITGSATTTTNFAAIGESGGSRSLTKNGASTIVLNAANSYSGGTVLNAGILEVGASGDLGLGDVTVNGGTLILNSFESIADSASLFVTGGQVNLNHSGIEVVSGLTVGSTVYDVGIYTASELGFDGAGSIQVVPEPASLGALALGGLGLLARRRRQV